MKFITDDHRQIVLGSLLGNGYICKDYLCIKHSIQHKSWLHTKALSLNPYASATPFYEKNSTIMWRSARSPLFEEIYEMCYKGKKTITMEWLDQLRALGISVWYGDKGILRGRNDKNACLRTQAFGREGNEVIERYFNEVGVPCRINKSRGSYVILFTVKGTYTLMSKLVAPNLPRNRYYKILKE